jgi:plastocyanin
LSPTRSLRLASALLAAALGLAPQAAVAAPMLIKAKPASNGGWKWAPDVEHLVTPKRVKWKNPTEEPHSVKFYKGPLEGERFLVPEGESRIRKIKKAGTYKYRCDILDHSTMNDGKCSGMCGKIVAH